MFCAICGRDLYGDGYITTRIRRADGHLIPITHCGSDKCGKKVEDIRLKIELGILRSQARAGLTGVMVVSFIIAGICLAALVALRLLGI